MTEPRIEIITPPAELRDRRQRKDGQEFFDRGERIIHVDGVRWGRTVVTWHGCHGTKTAFRQDGGDIITRTSKNDYTFKDVVNSASERHGRRYVPGKGYCLPDGWKGTEELVFDKVRELVSTGRLRDPAIVKAEHVDRATRRTTLQREARAKEDALFRQRAAEAVRANDPNGEIVDRVIEAMRWAQAQ